ncbi:MAG: S-layer homology domain-containing protein [Candidatus Roizmanbacteria bacterium]|nr:S-layer homology domain-containing protein [Candidatus Roizmanbacteria bacterium]
MNKFMQKITVSLATLAVLFGQVFGAFAGLSFATADEALAGGGGLPSKVNSSSIREMNGSYYINYCTDVRGYLTAGVYQATSSVSSKRVAVIADEMRTVAQCSYVLWDGNYGDQNEVGRKGQKAADGEYFYGITLEGESPYSYGTDYEADWFTVGSTVDDTDDDTYEEDDDTDDEEDDDTYEEEDATPKAKIIDVTVKNTTFDPWNDEESKLTFTLDNSAKVTLTIEDEDGYEVATLIDEESYKKGKHSVKWDGTDEWDDIVTKGEYTYILKAKSSRGTDTEEGTLKVKKGAKSDKKDTGSSHTDDPRLEDVFVTKDDFDPNAGESTYIVYTLTADSDVVVSVYDEYGDKVEELEYESDKSAGTYSVEWNGGNEDEGSYTYEIYAENSEGDDSQEGSITLSEDSKTSGKPNIYRDMADEGVYFPSEGDMSIRFRLNKDADVTIEIRDGSTVLATIIKNAGLLEGVNSVKWDGSDKYGETLEQGFYQYKIIAANNKGKDIELGTFMITGSTQYKYTNSCGSFTDMTEDSAYCEAIQWAYDSGIFSGYNDGSFKPYKSLTRAEALKVILESQNVQIENVKGQNFGFYDVDSYAWYTSYLKTALDLGIVHGYNDGSFRPNNTVSRVEALAMLLNTAEVTSNVVVPTNNYGQPYYDTPNTSGTKWYMSYVWFAKEYNLTGNDYYFYPDSSMTRGEMADMLYRLAQAGF